MEILPDMPIDEPPVEPTDLEVDIVTSGNGSGRITSLPAGIDCGSTCMGSFEEGTMITLTAEPDESSEFTGWGGACSGTTPVCEVTVAAATSVTATFTLKQYDVTVTRSGAGSGTVTGNGINCGTGAGCTITVDHGTAISLTATPAALNIFVGWGGACSGTSTCDLTITEDTDISAAFALDNLSLIVTAGGNGAGTITSAPAGINCPGTCDFVFTANQMVTLTANPAASSNFAGWSSPCSGTGTCVVTMDAAKTVTGTFTLKRYTLDVTKTGGTGTGTVSSTPAGIACGGDCTEMYDHGQTIQLTATPTAGHSFMGWSGACSGATTTCNVTLNAAATVNARFDINTYPLTTSVTGTGTITSTPAGISCPGTCAQSYSHNTIVMLSQSAGTGYTFTGWGGACSGMGACSVTMDQARNVTATFTINSYALDVSVVGMGSVSAPQIACPNDCSGTYTHGTVVSLSHSAATGYTFAGWNGACVGPGACNVTMDQMKSVTATFTLNRYPLSVSFPAANTGTGSVTATGISCPGDCSEDFDHGTVVTVMQTPSPDSNFTGWGGACTGTGACMPSMTQMRNVTASYALKTYDLNVSVTGNGTVSHAGNISCQGTAPVGDCVGTYNHGTMVTLTQSAMAGYQFTGWTGDCMGTGACTVTMTAVRNVGATFTQLRTLAVTIAGSTGTVSSNPGGISCPTDCTQDYLNNTMVTLTAAGTGGATFASWTNAPGCTTSTTCSVTMSQARNVTANFTPPSFQLTVSHSGGYGTITSSPGGIDCSNNGGANNVDCNQTYVQNTVVTLTATPTTNTVAAEASYFNGWSGACSGMSTQCTVTMDAAKDAVAHFELYPNVMFVTSRTYSTEELGSTWPNRAATICKAAVDGSQKNVGGVGPHQNTTWVPWISGVNASQQTINARDALNGFAGWERVDGMPVFQELSDIAGNNIIYPPNVDEHGQSVSAPLVWTGTDSTGRHSGSSCVAAGTGVSWTGFSQATGTQGLASANSLQFTDMTGVSIFPNPSCGTPRRLYCFGADRKAKINVPRQSGRLAFTSESTYRPGQVVQDGSTNLVGAPAMDFLCKKEAAAAGLQNAGRFKALVATTEVSAISRFEQGRPWVRVGDQQVIASDAQMRSTTTPRITVAPNAMANGTRIGNWEIWTGAETPATPGGSAGTCANWSNAGATKSTAGFAFDTGMTSLWFSGYDNATICEMPRHFVCMEE